MNCCVQIGGRLCTSRRRDCLPQRLQGFSQMELLLALALGSGLCLTAAHYYLHARQLQAVQQNFQRSSEAVVVLQHILGDAVERSFHVLPVCGGGYDSCPVWLNVDDRPAVMVVNNDSVGSTLQIQGDVLALRDGFSAEGGYTQYFTALHRNSGVEGLYRRRARSDSGYYAAEELVQGLSGLQVTACYPQPGSDIQPLLCLESESLVQNLHPVLLRICVQQVDVSLESILLPLSDAAERVCITHSRGISSA